MWVFHPYQFFNEMAREITDKSDVECNFYQPAADVCNPSER